MDQSWPHSPARATLFYTVCLILLLLFGGELSRYFGLPGVAATQTLVFFGLALLFAVMVGGPEPRLLLRIRMLTATGLLKTLFLGLLGWALAHSVTTLSVYMVNALGGKIPEYYQSITRAPFLVALLIGALLPAFCEEVAFRGYVLWNLNSLGRRAAVLATAILFGAMHMSLIRLVPLVVLGLLFSSAVQRTGSLLPGMILHFVNNATALSLSFYFRSAGGGGETPPADPSLVSVLMLIAAAVVLGSLTWSLARTFGPDDLAKPLPEGDPTFAPVPAMSRERKALSGIFLLPAAAMYLFAVARELSTVF